MAQHSTIEWTDHTFNPWWGCTKVSDGCKFCYAESIANRYGHDVWGPSAERRTFGDKHWAEPLKWNKDAERDGERQRVFCASMADVFDERAPKMERERLWKLIRDTPHLDWQVLTKRPQLIADNLPADWGKGYNNVWLGTSVEDARVLHRVEQLTSVPAAIHFLSLEPLIGPLDNLHLEYIEWVIVGGESGPRARPMELEWVESIRVQCEKYDVPFFFKQWGGAEEEASRSYFERPHLRWNACLGSTSSMK